MPSNQTALPATEVSLFWLPLGADGNPAVRWGGRAYEAVVARHERRERLMLFHSALRVRLRGTTYVVEVAPTWGAVESDRGVVCEGPVGLAWLGRSRFFRYEIRRWRSGVIPDMDQAVDSPVDLGATDSEARVLLDLVPECPTPAWGRDALGAGDMWNSNSVVAWLVTRAGLLDDAIGPPRNGRAPGWRAGVQVARRQLGRTASDPGATGHAPPCDDEETDQGVSPTGVTHAQGYTMRVDEK